MNRFVRLAIVFPLFVALLIGTFYWIEADKEIFILGPPLGDNKPMTVIENTIKTLHHSKAIEAQQADGSKLVTLESAYNLHLNKAFIQVQDGHSTQSRIQRKLNLKKVSTWLGIVLFGGFMLFQIALAAGMPWGEYAWGGQNRVLPSNFRKGSIIAALIFGVGVLIIMQLGGLIQFALLGWIAPTVTAILFLIFLWSIIGNSLSGSKKERLVMIPLSVLCAWVCFAFLIF
ncbi:MAG: hypothetical protein MRY78_17650 [Saprospiraceae bacterium]|nr:hypothetical protein [Saprospiraceae bacterium]